MTKISTKDKITTEMLSGAHRTTWHACVRSYMSGEYDHLEIRDLWKWGKKQLGLNCTLACFTESLRTAVDRQAVSNSTVSASHRRKLAAP